MFERFSRSARATVKAARHIAADNGSPTVEAEHLLLALTQHSSARTRRALQSLGVSDQAVHAALDEEFAHALQTVGVATTTPPRPLSRPMRSSPRFGQSAKLALERTLQVALDRGHKSLDDSHILVALTQAEAGVIPGVLRALNVTPSDIDTALR